MRAAIAIGSNVGDRTSHLRFARERLQELLEQARFSSAFETEPVGVAGDQGAFLNAAAVGETRLGPRELLKALLAIETSRGRTRPYPGAARTLDLDLILLGDCMVNEPGLIVPHPRFRERRFVLEPLAEVGPDLLDPVTGRTVRELFEALAPRR